MTRLRDLLDWIIPWALAVVGVISVIACGLVASANEDLQAEQAMSIYAQERYQAGYLQALRDTGAAPAPMGGAK